MTTNQLLTELLAARERREPCILATVAATTGSVPREAGAKALVFADGRLIGTIGGGKLESLVVADALASLRGGQPVLKTYPLHETAPDSFGAICGGTVTIFLEPHPPCASLTICGGGHCGQALAQLALQCGWHVELVDDRAEHLRDVRASVIHCGPVPDYLASRTWTKTDAVVLVNRNHVLDREGLATLLANPGAGYVGMMGSRRKVRAVMEELQSRGVPQEQLARIHAPVGLDLDADAPMEIAISILAEIMMVLRKRSGQCLSQAGTPPA